MRNVLNLVAFANPDDVSEVVLDDAEVIAMIVDVGGKQQRITTAHDALLAQIGRPPVDFQTQLVRLHDLWRLCAEERVTRPRLTTCRRGLEQKREWAALQLRESRNRCVRVEQTFFPHRDQCYRRRASTEF